ncbi:hypothetical protein D3C78_1409880 [compost metagenome]
MTSDQIQTRCVLHQWIEVILRPPAFVIGFAQLLPARLQQGISLIVHFQQTVRRCQIQGAQIGFPTVWIQFLQRILHRGQRVGGNFALQGQQVDRPGTQTQMIHIIITVGCQLTQRAVGIFQHPYRQGITRRFGFQQVLHHVWRDERIGLRR